MAIESLVYFAPFLKKLLCLAASLQNNTGNVCVVLRFVSFHSFPYARILEYIVLFQLFCVSGGNRCFQRSFISLQSSK